MNGPSSAPRRSKPVIAIDGPSGVGKSTLAGRLAQALNFTKLDTGAMYRALALKALDEDMDFDDEAALGSLAERTRIILEPMTHTIRVQVDGQDVTQRIREADVTQAASRVSVHPRVRAWMVTRQRALGAAGGVVMEGRDIGTKVFPDAEVKFFLDASERARGERRYLQQVTSGNVTAGEQTPLSPELVLQQLHERDERDRTREASPLEPAPDAIVLDTTTLTLEEVVARSLEIIDSRFPGLVRPVLPGF
jgi:cytidylate kinase